MTYNPERWLSSMIDTMQSTVETKVKEYLGLGVSDQNGVEILWDHFASDREGNEPVQLLEMDRAVIHFNIDDVDVRPLGFGRNVVDGNEIAATVDDPATLTEHMGRMAMVNFDVGVVATDAAGGSSARFTVYEMLDYIFNGADKKQLFRTETGGIEIVSFSRGRFAPDKINDVRVFRVVGAELVVRVYSRDVASDPVVIVDQEPIQLPDVEIGGEPIT